MQAKYECTEEVRASHECGTRRRYHMPSNIETPTSHCQIIAKRRKSVHMFFCVGLNFSVFKLLNHGGVLHGESNIYVGKASPRTTIQCMRQPQEAMQT